MTFQPEESKATTLWLAILAAVLSVLFVMTMGTSGGGDNFFLDSDSDAIGAELMIDGKSLGIIKGGRAGLGGGSFWAHLTAGPHNIHISKKGYDDFDQKVVMKGEEYIHVDLKKKSE